MSLRPVADASGRTRPSRLERVLAAGLTVSRSSHAAAHNHYANEIPYTATWQYVYSNLPPSASELAFMQQAVTPNGDPQYPDYETVREEDPARFRQWLQHARAVFRQAELAELVGM